MKRNYQLILSSFIMALLIFACNTEKQLLDNTNPTSDATSIMLLDNNNDASWPTDPFVINDLEINGDELITSLSYGGGCQDHIFQLIADDVFSGSTPPAKVDLTLSHNANSDPCEAWLTNNQRFNLNDLKALYQARYQLPSGSLILRINNASEVAYSF